MLRDGSGWVMVAAIFLIALLFAFVAYSWPVRAMMPIGNSPARNFHGDQCGQGSACQAAGGPYPLGSTQIPLCHSRQSASGRTP